jgi:hypothetical protein
MFKTTELLTFRNGDVYEGDLRMGEMHGFGTYRWPDNRMYVGDWEHGVRTGFGKCYYKDGGIYEGHVVNDRKHGSGIESCVLITNLSIKLSRNNNLTY